MSSCGNQFRTSINIRCLASARSQSWPLLDNQADNQELTPDQARARIQAILQDTLDLLENDDFLNAFDDDESKEEEEEGENNQSGRPASRESRQ